MIKVNNKKILVKKFDLVAINDIKIENNKTITKKVFSESSINFY